MTNNRHKLLQINFDVNTLISCHGNNFVYSFSFLKKIKHNYFHSFQNDLGDLLTPKGSHFISKYMLLCIEG